MKRIKRALATVTASAALVPAAALAITIAPPQGTDILAIIQTVITWLLGFAAAIAVLILIIGGLRYIISAGNSDQIEAAKSTIFNAILGLVVIALSYVIVTTVLRLLGAGG